jgi:hypothetical protein
VQRRPAVRGRCSGHREIHRRPGKVGGGKGIRRDSGVGVVDVLERGIQVVPWLRRRRRVRRQHGPGDRDGQRHDHSGRRHQSQPVSAGPQGHRQRHDEQRSGGEEPIVTGLLPRRDDSCRNEKRNPRNGRSVVDEQFPRPGSVDVQPRRVHARLRAEVHASGAGGRACRGRGELQCPWSVASMSDDVDVQRPQHRANPADRHGQLPSAQRLGDVNVGVRSHAVGDRRCGGHADQREQHHHDHVDRPRRADVVTRMHA